MDDKHHSVCATQGIITSLVCVAEEFSSEELEKKNLLHNYLIS